LSEAIKSSVQSSYTLYFDFISSFFGIVYEDIFALLLK